MDELINDFIAETRDMAQALSGAIVAWEAAPDDRARLDEIFRFVHTVKGNCGFFDLPRLAALSHAAEDALAEVRAGKRPRRPTASSTPCSRSSTASVSSSRRSNPAKALGSEDDEQLIAALVGRRAVAALQPEAPPAAEADTKKAVRSIRLSVDLLDRMMSGVSDVVLARNELARRLRDRPRDVADRGGVRPRLADVSPKCATPSPAPACSGSTACSPACRAWFATFRAELGKQVRLEVDGGDVELDREMIEMIRDPLTHIVRNAIDHGIESADERRAAGKPSPARSGLGAAGGQPDHYRDRR